MNYNFTSLSNQLVTNIQQISTNVNSLQRLVNQLGTDEDDGSHRQKLQTLQHQTNELAKQCNRDIQQLTRIIPIADPTHYRECRVLSEKIRSDFLIVLKTFQEIQTIASQRVKHFVVKQSKPEINHKNPFYVNEEYNFESTTLSFKDEPKVQTHVDRDVLDEERDRLELAEQQNKAIIQLESDIRDVNQIFIDISKLVSEQGEVLNNIEVNIETAVSQTDAGNQQLRTAAEYQAKARKKRLFIVVIFAIIIFILTLIIYFSVNH